MLQVFSVDTNKNELLIEKEACIKKGKPGGPLNPMIPYNFHFKVNSKRKILYWRYPTSRLICFNLSLY